MGNRVTARPLHYRPILSIVMPLIVAVPVMPLQAKADSTSIMKQSGSQKMGNRLGQFMGSFMDGLNPPSTVREKLKQPDRKVEQDRKIEQDSLYRDLKPQDRPEQIERRSSPRDLYDPWGVTRERVPTPPPFYDPWGVTGGAWGLERFADRDWTLGRRFYGSGLGPWDAPGYEMTPSPRFEGDPRDWNRGYRQNWPAPPEGYYPYGGNRYGNPGWNW